MKSAFRCGAAAVAAAAMSCLLSCTGKVDPTAGTPNHPDAGAPVKITQFYTSQPALPRGESALLCYGVENASAVRLTPPVETVWPALSRCFEVSPAQSTTFTLTAEDLAGKQVARDVVVKITGRRPRFTDLSISAKTVAPGQTVNFCFKAKDAVRVKGKPGRFLQGANPKGDCLTDRPRETHLRIDDRRRRWTR